MTSLTPLLIKPSFFPEHVVDRWRSFVDPHLEGPSECANGALLGVEIAHMLRGTGGYPVSEICAFFFREDDVCRGHIMLFPSSEAAQKCSEITTDVEGGGPNFDLLTLLFHHSEWPGKQLHTVIFRDFTLFYDAYLIDDRPVLPSRFKLILHDTASAENLTQLKQHIEMCLEGVADANDGLYTFRFVVDLDEIAANAA